jgi:hypothetical protein
MMALELPVKSIIVEKPTGYVARDIIAISGACAVGACLIAISLVGSKLHLLVEPFAVRLDGRHPAWGARFDALRGF